jgi:hypothetical protein
MPLINPYNQPGGILLFTTSNRFSELILAAKSCWIALVRKYKFLFEIRLVIYGTLRHAKKIDANIY